MALGATTPRCSLRRVRYPRLLSYRAAACHQSHSRVHQAPAVTVLVAMMTSMEDLTGPRNQGLPAKDLQAIAVARERPRGTRESNTDHRELTETNSVKALGVRLLILVMRVMKLVASHLVSLSAHSKCPALSLPETSLAMHLSASL